MKSEVSLRCLNFDPQSPIIVHYKTTKETIHLCKGTSSAYGIVMNKMYMHHHGKIYGGNDTTGDTFEVNLKANPFFGDPDTTIDGVVKDVHGDIKVTLTGDWKTHMQGTVVDTNEDFMIFEKYNIPENYAEQYCYPPQTKELNHLNIQMLRKIRPTDTRFRPDQRALEYGEWDLAQEEKNRLEDLQRQRRKLRKERNETHKPKYFEKKHHDGCGKDHWVYIGDYWEQKEKVEKEGGTNWGDVLEIY